MSANLSCFYPFSAGLPLTGRLKWIVAYASHDTSDDDWTSLFSQSSPGLHGFYGIDGEPSDDSSVSVPLANNFINSATGGTNIHSAWQNAVVASGAHIFGEWELYDAMNDVIGTSPASSGVWSGSNPVEYTSMNGMYVYPQSLQSLNSTSPGTYQPYALTTESYSDSALLSQANSAEGSASGSQISSNEYRVASATFSGSHFEGSQGLIESSVHSSDAYNYSQSAAQAFVTQYMQQQGAPLPSDAQLQNVQEVTRTQSGQSTAVTMGYIFTWVHSNLTFGGDYIRIGVDNVPQTTCTEYNQNDPPNNKPPCLQHTTTYNQHVNVFYRLWRQRNTTKRYPLGTGSAALSPQQAFNLANASPKMKGGNPGTFAGYVYSYYTPAINSTDNTAYPAYHFFYSNHVVYTVDAYSGSVVDVNNALN